MKEEIGIDITGPIYIVFSNDKFEQENKHYITIFMQAEYPEEQKIINPEPHKYKDWQWFDMDKIPENLFLSVSKYLK